MTNIELTDEDAQLFLEFRQHRDLFKMLLNKGVFDTRRGEVILHFDAEGLLKEIRISTVRYHY